MGLFDRLRRGHVSTETEPAEPAGPPQPTPPPPSEPQPEPPSGPQAMEGFGYKCSWLAVRTDDQGAVIRALGLDDARPASWPAAVEAAYEGTQVMVTPPLPGVGGDWVLVAGDPVEQPIEHAVELSRALGTTVHRYATFRVTASVRWARIEDGRLVRLLSKDDGTLNEWVGVTDDVERGLGLAMYGDAATLDEVTRIDESAGEDAYGWLLLDEDEVQTVTAAWSLSPFELDGPAPDQPPQVATPRW